MARILYGVAGEGMGHATRTKAVLEQLRGHDVTVVSSSRAYQYLRRFFPRVHRIFGFHIIYWNNSVSNAGIFLSTIARLPWLTYSFLRTFWLALTLRPDVIVTDYEPFTCYAGALLGIPTVSVNNQHLLNRAFTRYPEKNRWEAFKTRLANALLVPVAKQYVVTTFSFGHPVAKHTTLVPPLIRQALQRLPITEGRHVLVYQTSRSNKNLLDLLRLLPEQFVVYGFGARKGASNVTFKAFDEEEFGSDLATCKAVITNGGYSLISEALTLGKPVLAEPVQKQFEQELNALLLEREGYGKRVRRITVDNLFAFLQHLERYRAALKRFQLVDKNAGVTEAVRVIERVILRASSAAPQSSGQGLSRAGSPSPFRLMR
jgi:uncharacterized protein (TIGR00661 family)